ncbi:MAG: PQQ-binding-like beta-propeller repeat protein [Alphaproteobacteria bacterium]|nr:PQQ-binding-like beta-propeller repeat protein [Alphaproteobacteria bacterium]
MRSTFAALLAAATLCASSMAIARDPENIDWPAYSADLAATKYVPLDQISAENLDRLEVVWTWMSPDNDINAADIQTPDGQIARASGNRATPLVVDGVLYVRTSLSVVAAVNAETGKTIWTFDPQAYRGPRPANYGHVTRGLTFWERADGDRIIFASTDGRLFVLDAATGKPVVGFGQEGVVDVGKLLRFPEPRQNDRVPQQQFGFISPPTLCDGVIVIGAVVTFGSVDYSEPLGYSVLTHPRGDVRGFDAETGELRWVFHTIPRDGEFGNDTWKNESWRYTGKGNVWSMTSCDEDLGLVYLPVTSAETSLIGVQRPGDNLFTQSIVALEAATGERSWHFQTIHHDLWDYDLPAAPVLMDITVDGRAIPALAQVTKTNYLYVLDRRDGTPVWPIEERPVPRSVIKGEYTSPTQPIPVKPAPYDVLPPITDDKVVDLTPELQAAARELLAKTGPGELYTPIGTKPTLILPGTGGGGNWTGGAFDPESQIFYVPSWTGFNVMQFRELDRTDPAVRNVPYGLRRTTIPMPNNFPITRPPYARITAIDMTSGEHLWRVPFGEGYNQHPALAGRTFPPLGSWGFGAVIATRTLLFSAERGHWGEMQPLDEMRPKLRAHDKATGSVLWSYDLPSTYWGAAPMSYMVNGRQFIVVALGGTDRGTQTNAGPPHQLVAFALAD